jgi:hypothetical protein
MTIRVALILAIVVGSTGTSSCERGGPLAPKPLLDSLAVPASQAVAFVNVSVLSPEDGVLRAGMTVVTQGALISAVGPSASVTVPDSAHRVDGTGRVLMPGLVDMHVHLRTAELMQYVASGITTVRNMWGFQGLKLTIQRVGTGELRGPRIYSTSPGVDGLPGHWPETRFLTNPDSADAIVKEFKAAGWKFIKSYNDLTKPAYLALAAAARANGIAMVGHIPPSVTLLDALANGQRSSEHISAYDRAMGGRWGNVSFSGATALVSQTVASGMWNCPTLTVLDEVERIHGWGNSRISADRRTMVRYLHEGGAKLIIGTDAGATTVVGSNPNVYIAMPGTSMVKELHAMRESGLTSTQILRMATLGAAEFLGIADSVGTIGVGKWADLILLDGDPRSDLSHTAIPAGVVLRGEWLPRKYLAALTGR